MFESAERLKRQFAEADQAGVRLSIREKLIREALEPHKNKPRQLRRAEAFKYLLEKTPIHRYDGELIAGSIIGLFPLLTPQPSFDSLLEEADSHIAGLLEKNHAFNTGRALMEHDFDYRGCRLQYEDLKEISRILSGKYKTLSCQAIFSTLQQFFSISPQIYSTTTKALGGTKSLLKVDAESFLWNSANHLAVNYGKVLKHGFGGLREKALKLRLSTSDGEAGEFYDAVEICLTAASNYIRRYEGCGHLAEAPAKSFRDALQLFWFTHIIMATAGGIALAAGRFDQYMLPYLQADKISSGEALELLCNLWVRFNEPRIGAVQNLTIGGMTGNGQDGVNDLTYLCLEAANAVAMPYPNLSARFSYNPPEKYFDACIDTVASGHGQPALFNDKIFVKALEKSGFDLHDARNYCVMGCVEIMIPEKMPSWEFGPSFRFPQILLRTLREKTNYHNFSGFLFKFKQNLFAEIDRLFAISKDRYRDLRKIGCDPFGSALIDNCLERGRDFYRGGAVYPAAIGAWGVGLGTATDSLFVLKKLVFDEKELTVDEFLEVVNDDFFNHELLRQRLINRIHKFGNDVNEVDSLAAGIADAFCRHVLKHRGPDGEFYLPLLASYIAHVNAGNSLGATPDGRKAGAPLSDAASPVQGRDVSGLTAALNSVCKINFSNAPGGVAVNFKLPEGFLNNRTGRERFKALLKAYFCGGGAQVVFNLVATKTLREAVDNPEAYRNIVVRVAGFNEFFHKLDRKLQLEIISRNEQII